jgi:meiotically up-regulated gene 157 (Mug157) protein
MDSSPSGKTTDKMTGSVFRPTKFEMMAVVDDMFCGENDFKIVVAREKSALIREQLHNIEMIDADKLFTSEIAKCMRTMDAMDAMDAIDTSIESGADGFESMMSDVQTRIEKMVLRIVLWF